MFFVEAVDDGRLGEDIEYQLRPDVLMQIAAHGLPVYFTCSNVIECILGLRCLASIARMFRMRQGISMLKRTFALMAITMAAFGESSLANQAMERPLQEKVAESDIVFLGTVQQSDYVMPEGKGRGRAALVRVDTPLKGNPKGDVVVAIDTGISEMEPLCCEAGGVYLFFLSKAPDGTYVSVNGPFGIYKVKGILPTFPWQTNDFKSEGASGYAPSSK